ncbi:EcsC family protein [uncultured Chryseobacterium sp.]|uniref:EcsC family protein n=1 Tax=uncultured Chryseobacterium sp. TaxID=259322 RepID=UPI0025DD8134|nr:EcsC family protein [uncultured Chryseobacterium sp.]
MDLSEHHLEELRQAMQILENPGIIAKITNVIGQPLEKALAFLPKNVYEKIGSITETALMKAAETAVFTLKDTPNAKPSNGWHKFGVAAFGAVGGFFGLPALAIELPVSTTLMLRSVVDIARSQGESINDPAVKVACLEVFALGGRSESDDASESGYFAARIALAQTMAEAAKQFTSKTMADESASVIVKLISKIAARFSVQVSEKVTAQAVPAIGAAGGAIINTLFINHFQDMAKGHFTVRRLEKIYGADTVKTAYENLRRK